MSELNYNPLIFVVVGIGALLAALWAVRWWRLRSERQDSADYGGSRGPVSSWRASWRAQEHVWHLFP